MNDGFSVFVCVENVEPEECSGQDQEEAELAAQPSPTLQHSRIMRLASSEQ